MKVKVNNQKLLKKGGNIPKYFNPFRTMGRIANTVINTGKRTFKKSPKTSLIAMNPVLPPSVRVASGIYAYNSSKKATQNTKRKTTNDPSFLDKTSASLTNAFRDINEITEYRNSLKTNEKNNKKKPSNGGRNKTISVKTTTQPTATQSAAVQPVTTQTSNLPETTTTINAPMYQNLLSDMTMYKNNPDTFVQRFGNLNGNYTGFASKTPGQQYATSINDMTDEARTQYLQGLNGLYDMYQKDPTEAINYAKYNFFVPQNNATVGDYAQAQLNSTKPQNNISPTFYNQVTNWYANNKPTIDNYFNSNTNYSQDFNQKVQNFLDKYKQYGPKYTFAKKGTKLISIKK